MSWKVFIGGLVVLVGVPLLAVLGLYTWVDRHNAVPQSGPLRCTVEPQWAWLGDAVAFTATVAPPPPVPGQLPPPPPPLDVVLLVDVSGSMTETLGTMAAAAEALVRELGNRPGAVNRMAVVQFDTLARVLSDWTSDPAAIARGLGSRAMMTGGNDSRAAFDQLDELIDRSRPEARRLVVFYTDGVISACPECPGGPMTFTEMSGRARSLEIRGVQFWAIGLPGRLSQDMARITGSQDRLLTPAGQFDLLPLFRRVADAGEIVAAEQARLTHRVDGRLFGVPEANESWAIARDGALTVELRPLRYASAAYRHHLVPREAGVMAVDQAPAGLSYLDPSGALAEPVCAQQPMLLVLAPWPLFLAWLPALLWLLFGLSELLRHGPRPVEAEPAAPGVVLPATADVLPLPVAPVRDASPPVPTLFLGLGGFGRDALRAIHGQLAQAHPDDPAVPYRLIGLDLDRRSGPAAAGPDSSGGGPVPLPEIVLAPAELADLSGRLPGPGETRASRQWFPTDDYRHAARADLDLSGGAHRDRCLGRLALLDWLDAGLVEVLAEALERLDAEPSPGELRQVVIVAGMDGGFGGAVCLDVARLVRRLARARQAEAGPGAMVPEVALALGAPDDLPIGQAANRAALAQEIATAALTGLYPHRVALGERDERLDRVDDEPPFNFAFQLPGDDAAATVAQAGALGAVLADRVPRQVLLAELDREASGPVTAVSVAALQVPSGEQRDLLARELALLLLGGEVLLRLVPAPEGGLGLPPVAPEAAQLLLAEWPARETGESPWTLLLQAAHHADHTEAFLASLEMIGEDNAEWFRQAIAAAVSRALCPAPGDSVAAWSPAEAIAVLRLLAERLDRNVCDMAHAVAAPDAVTELLALVSGLSRDLAGRVQVWATELAGICTAMAREQQARLRSVGHFGATVPGRVLGGGVDGSKIGQAVREALLRWLGSETDVVARLRERLAFAVRVAGDRHEVVLRARIGDRADFRTPQEASAAVRQWARAVVRGAAALDVAGAVETLDDRELRAAAAALVPDWRPAAGALLIRPSPPPGQETRRLETLVAAVEAPAGQGHEAVAEGRDASAVRRLAWNPPVQRSEMSAAELPVVQGCDVAAQRLRRRIAEHFETMIEPVPAALRLALSHPAAFRSFTSAYRAGRIVRREDATGRQHWVFTDRGLALTDGEDASLAAAAANYVYRVEDPPAAFAPGGIPGSTAVLEDWLAGRLRPDTDLADVATLAAMAVCAAPAETALEVGA